MQKKVLLSLPIEPLQTDLQLDDEFIETKSYQSGGEYEISKNNYIYSIHLDNSTGGQVLILDMYKPSGEHLWRYFLNKSGQYFTIRKDKEDKISNAGLDYILEYSWNTVYHMANEHALSLTQDFFKNNKIDDPLRYISGKNQKYKTEKNEARLNKIRESLDNAMLEICPLPKAVEQWVENTLLKASRYIFYDYSNKATVNGYCTHCKHDVVVNRPHNNTQGKCPHCRSIVIFKAHAAFLKSYGFKDRETFVYFQSIKNGFCMREFIATRYFYREKDSYKYPYVDCHETFRAFYSFESTGYKLDSSYEYDQFMNIYEHRFLQSYGTIDEPRYIYPNNLNKLLKYDSSDKLRKHLDFNGIAKHCRKITPSHLINKPVEYNIIETTYKSRLYNLVSDVINYKYNKIESCDVNATNIKDGFGITKEFFADMQKINITLDDLIMYKFVLEKEKHVDIDIFKELCSMGAHDSIYKLLEYTTVYRIAKYTTEQHKLTPKESKNSIMIDWLDYLKNVKSLKFDLKKYMVKFPRDLKKAHDESSVLARLAEIGGEIPAIEAMQNDLNKRFAFETKKLLIRAPKSHADIINEANVLDHCVWRYAKDVAIGKTIILFIRKTNDQDKPYFTLELNSKTLKIRQCRGKGNCSYGKEISTFIEQWTKAKLSKKAISA